VLLKFFVKAEGYIAKPFKKRAIKVPRECKNPLREKLSGSSLILSRNFF